MTPSATPLFVLLMSKKEANLKHAFIIVDDIDVDGKKTTVTHHYLTCEKCRLRRELGLKEHTKEEVQYGEAVQRDGT